MPGQKVRIVLKSFDHRVLDISTQQILQTAAAEKEKMAMLIILQNMIRKNFHY